MTSMLTGAIQTGVGIWGVGAGSAAKEEAGTWTGGQTWTNSATGETSTFRQIAKKGLTGRAVGVNRAQKPWLYNF